MGYLIATLMVLPLVVYGMKALTRLQVWTTPLWLVLMVVPVAAADCQRPGAGGRLYALRRQE